MLAAKLLVLDDIVLLGQGDNVPADCRLVEAFGVRVSLHALECSVFQRGRRAAIVNVFLCRSATRSLTATWAMR